MENDDVLIEVGPDSLIVQMGGVRSEVRGEDARLVKRIVAGQLLSAMANVPQIREREAEQRRYEGRAQGRLAGESSGLIASNQQINRAASRNY